MLLHTNALPKESILTKAGEQNLEIHRLSGSLYFFCGHSLSVHSSLYVPSEIINYKEHAAQGVAKCEADFSSTIQKRIDRQADFIMLDEEVCVISTPCSVNFFHWHEDLLKLAYFELCGFQGRYIIAENLPGFCYESMALLGILLERVIIARNDLRLSNAWICPGVSLFNISEYSNVLDYLRERMLMQFDSSMRGFDRIYLRRKGSRKVVNESQILDAISVHGFAIIEAESLPLAKQIEIFKHCKLLLGPHGAGFVHSIYMPRQSLLLEAFSPNHIYPCMLEVCTLLGHDHRILCANNAPWDKYMYGEDIVIPSDQLALALRNLGPTSPAVL